jgi:YbbR domain-containing protein
VVSKATLRSASHQAVPKKDEHEDDVEGTVKLTVVDAKLLKLMKGK